jgi:ligand-binding sensor domain-containing protein
VKLFLLLIAAVSINPAFAIDPNRATSQYIRDWWGPERGFPRGSVYAITQTPDGYLWIGTETGLVRFDGLNFVLVRDRSQSFTVENVFGLARDEEGTLWVRLEGSTLLRYRDGVFDNPTYALGWPYAIISAMSHTDQGELLISRMEQGAVTFRRGKFEMLATTSALPRSPVVSIAQTSNGEVWMGTRDAGLFRFSGEKPFSVREGLPDTKVNSPW